MQTRTLRCKLTHFIVLLVFGSCSLLAQTPERTPLVELFPMLEQQYNVRFSYASEEILQISVITPNTVTIEATLAYLTAQTPFVFTQINERYITVVLKDKALFFCGKIVDALTFLPLADATIITNDDRFSAVTNSEGSFTIPTSNALKIVIVRFLGYESIRIPISKLTSDCPVFEMWPTVSELDQVLLQTYFTKGISKQLDGSFLIKTDNFGLLPGQVDGDVLSIAQALPGVESADETVSNINIRGGTHDENNILWDDIRMFQSGHFFGLISAFNPDLTKKVSVVKNGTHPRYGEGVSGVIDMRSENKLNRKFSGGAGFNLINTHAFGEIPISDSFGVQVSGRRSINDILESPIYGIYEDRVFQDTEITRIESDETGTVASSDSNFRFYDFSTKFLWDFSEKGKLRVNFLTIDNVLEFNESIDNLSRSETSDLKQRSLVAGISWEQSWNERLKTNLLVSGSYYLLNSVNEEIFTTQVLTQENEVLDLGLKADVSYTVSEKATLDGGYHFSEIGIGNTQDINLPRFRSFEKNVLRSHIGYINLKYSLNAHKTDINAGLRTNYFTKFDKVLIEPRLSVLQKIGGGFSAQVLGEFKSQTTTQRIDFESDFLGVEKRRWVLADDMNVPIIESKQLSAGLIFNKNNWFVNLEGFYKIVDGITTSNQGFQNQFQFTRTTGSYNAKGFEFVMNKKSKDFSTWISYMYIKNDYTFEALIPSEFPSNLDIRHSATLANVYTHNNLKLALGIDWHSGKPYTKPKEGEETTSQNGIEAIVYSNPNSSRLPNYFRTNLSAEYLWDVNERLNAKFNVALLNAFDTKNTLNIRYALDTAENGDSRVNKIEEVSLGLTPNFSIQLLF